MPATVLFRFCKSMFTFFSLFALINNSLAQQKDASTGNNFTTVANKKGAILGYSASSGVKILTVNGLHFKDLNKNGKLDKYEDWRLGVEERAKDLASKMTCGEIISCRTAREKRSPN